MTWIRDLFAPKRRDWEQMYRNRWAYDKVVRSTHGVNCTGSCSWNIYVKQGIVTWEMQALDYQRIDPKLPPYEPRGCQRGISYSWYIYSPIRVKYPYIRGVLLDLWEAAKEKFPNDPVRAWGAITSTPALRAQLGQSRGKGGLRRASWEQAHEIISAANIYTVMEHGPDRLIGFSPIPAMSMISYASGARFMQLMGGVCLSFYDWYCDLPPASPETWGEQTDVAESADWFKSEFIAVVGSNVLMTRTPDAHFLVEARHKGTKVVVFSPDLNMTAKVADEWLPVNQGQDAAFWMAVSHVLLKEFYIERQVPYFIDYLKRYSDSPFVVVLEKDSRGRYQSGPMLRTSECGSGEENAEWKFYVIDDKGDLRTPQGTVGHRWQTEKGKWNLRMVDDTTGEAIDPMLTLESNHDEVVPVVFPDFSEAQDDQFHSRGVYARKIETENGPVLVTTVFELLLASYGVNRGVEGDWPSSYEDDSSPYTPAWQEKFSGISGDIATQFARQWGSTAEKSEGRCSIIIGAGVNHWYHNNLIYKSCITALILGGCVGRNGGGLNHYVGQEKLVPSTSWAPIAFAKDWGGPPRLQNAPSFHYMHSDQWRYDRSFNEVCPVSDIENPLTSGHTADKQAMAVRAGWLPCFPQFNKSNFEVLREARESGASEPQEMKDYIVDELKARRLRFSMEDPNNPESYPRVWYIWRGNAIQSSAKGHEYFLKHYLGTHNNSIAKEEGKDFVEDVVWHDKVELGKMDLIIDLNYRMDTSALYSDIVLPAATYYEKDDLNTTDMHSFIHPLQAAVPPCWESKSDWKIFREIAEHTSKLAERYLPEPVQDVVLTPLMHDSPAEMAQRHVRDWAKGECEPIPGKTMSNITLVERDYTKVYQKFISFGPKVRDGRLGKHGISYSVTDLYNEYLETNPTETWGGETYPSLANDRDVCEIILAFAPETNGELAWRAYEDLGKNTGIDHMHLASDDRGVRYTFDDIISQPCRILTTPFWSGVTKGKQTYAGFAQMVEELIPWRTLTGRQHLYLDHETYRAYGEHLPTFKPRAERATTRDLVHTEASSGTLVLNYLTPHGKWHIHSTYGDTLRMKTLSRGCEPLWINDHDAGLIGIRDNDWVEVINDHGVVVTRCVVTARLPRGMCFIYHATERTLGVPRSPGRGMKRAGGHNSLTRTRLKPLFMIGGYGQFSYGFNYWGPQGVNRDTFVAIRKIENITW